MAARTKDRPSREKSGYSLLQIILHWTVVALIAIQLVSNNAVEEIFNDRMDSSAHRVSALAMLHISVGISVFLLATLRLMIRLTRGAPPPPQGNSAIVTWLGILNHLCLYTLMFAMPLTGGIAWFGFSEVAAELHELGRFVLIPLIILHVLGALFEHFVLRQNTLLRMFRSVRQSGAMMRLTTVRACSVFCVHCL